MLSFTRPSGEKTNAVRVLSGVSPDFFPQFFAPVRRRSEVFLLCLLPSGSLAKGKEVVFDSSWGGVAR